MKWIEVSVATAHDGLEKVSQAILDAGAQGVMTEDEEEFRAFLEENRGKWDYVEDELIRNMTGRSLVKCYLTDNAAGYETLNNIRAQLERLKAENTDGSCGSLSLELKNRDDSEWNDSWKKYFKPFKVGKKLYIRPSWERIEDREDRLELVIEPGSLFGTGLHETTRLCLEELENTVKPGAAMLDVGTGSGILSIAGALLGAIRITSVDIDANVYETMRNNIELNHMAAEIFTIRAGNAVSDNGLLGYGGELYDVITVNIVADVILALLPHIHPHLKAEGKLILSGIIDTRRQEITDRLSECGYKIITERNENGWVMIAAQTC